MQTGEMPRIVTYNVHRCLGSDGVISPARIAAVIAGIDADIIALQELDVGRARSNGIDQAREIARELGHEHAHFHPALRVMEEEYGDAIITRQPSRLVKAGTLPLPGRGRLAEPRGALWASIAYGGVELQIINTHLGLMRAERLAQADALLGPEWLSASECKLPFILLGDFNSPPRGRTYKRLAAELTDAPLSVSKARATFPARYPLLRIDHIFVSTGIQVTGAHIVRGDAARRASDHLPLVADFELERSAAGQSSQTS